MSRPLAALASLVLTVSGLVVLLPGRAYACTCELEGGSREEIVEGALSDSEAVFSGEVVAVERETSTFYDTVTLRASEVWKGTGRGTLEVDVLEPCGNPFEEGRGYLVYAYGKGGLKTDSCTETKPLEKAGADLAVLGDGGRPTSGGASRTPLGALRCPRWPGWRGWRWRRRSWWWRDSCVAARRKEVGTPWFAEHAPRPWWWPS